MHSLWKHKVVTLFMALAMLFGSTLIGVASAAEPVPATVPELEGSGIMAVSAAIDDVTGHWAEAVIDVAKQYGIMGGFEDGTFRPDEPVTRAQFVAMVNRAFGFFQTGPLSFFDVTPGDWFYNDIAIGVNMGIISGYGDGSVGPNDSVTREQAFSILARVMKITAEPTSTTSFNDLDTISDWAKGSLIAMVNHGYLGGWDGGIHPKALLTRAQTAQSLYNVYGTIIDGNVNANNKVYEGNVTIRKAGSSLSNATIKGGLYITEGVSDGEAFLDNVQVEGRTYIAGGGNSTAHLTGFFASGELWANKPVVAGQQLLHVHIHSGSIDKIYALNSAIITIDEDAIFGDFEVPLGAFATALNLLGKATGEIYIDGNLGSAYLGNKSAFDTFVIAGAVDKIETWYPGKFEGTGSLGSFHAHVIGSEVCSNLDFNPANLITDEGVTVTIGDNQVGGTPPPVIDPTSPTDPPTVSETIPTSPTVPGATTPADPNVPQPPPGSGGSGGDTSPTTYRVRYYIKTGTGDFVERTDLARTVNSGSRISDPGITASSGWAFDGWYTSSSMSGTKWSFANDTVRSATNLYARTVELLKITSVSPVADDGTKLEVTFNAPVDVATLIKENFSILIKDATVSVTPDNVQTVSAAEKAVLVLSTGDFLNLLKDDTVKVTILGTLKGTDPLQSLTTITTDRSATYTQGSRITGLLDKLVSPIKIESAFANETNDVKALLHSLMGTDDSVIRIILTEEGISNTTENASWKVKIEARLPNTFYDLEDNAEKIVNVYVQAAAPTLTVDYAKESLTGYIHSDMEYSETSSTTGYKRGDLALDDGLKDLAGKTIYVRIAKDGDISGEGEPATVAIPSRAPTPTGITASYLQTAGTTTTLTFLGTPPTGYAWTDLVFRNDGSTPAAIGTGGKVAGVEKPIQDLFVWIPVEDGEFFKSLEFKVTQITGEPVQGPTIVAAKVESTIVVDITGAVFKDSQVNAWWDLDCGDDYADAGLTLVSIVKTAPQKVTITFSGEVTEDINIGLAPFKAAYDLEEGFEDEDVPPAFVTWPAPVWTWDQVSRLGITVTIELLKDGVRFVPSSMDDFTALTWHDGSSYWVDTSIDPSTSIFNISMGANAPNDKFYIIRGTLVPAEVRNPDYPKDNNLIADSFK
ncbi:MAG: S-layer homology domain-containing protein [Symbiobacteriaceae bacterium]|nr:S-layer homology domain-containing protein [Symbiobacteriaceae bacterium]